MTDPAPAKRVDEDWKRKAQAEKDAPGAGLGSAPAPPPADFRMLVASLAGQATHALGLVPPREGEEPAAADLPQARFTIDLLGMLEEKTRGNLSPEEDTLLRGVLTDLRMAFVERSRANP